MTKVPQGFDFSFLNEEEARKILQVLERNEELRRAEKDRIRYEANSSSWAGPASCWLPREPRDTCWDPEQVLLEREKGTHVVSVGFQCLSGARSKALHPQPPTLAASPGLRREEGESSSFLAFLGAWVPACSGHLG